MRTAEFGLEVVVDAAPPFPVSEAWWTKMNISVAATPTYEVASEGANTVVLVEIGVVAVMVSSSAVTVCPPMVHVPNTAPTSSLGMIRSQPTVGV